LTGLLVFIHGTHTQGTHLGVRRDRLGLHLEATGARQLRPMFHWLYVKLLFGSKRAYQEYRESLKPEPSFTESH